MAIGRRGLVIGAAAAGLTLAGGVLAWRMSRTGSGLVGQWGFDEAGGTVRDASGLGNDGSILPATALSTARGEGAFAGTLSSGGTGGAYVLVPPSQSLNAISSRLTVAAHVCPRRLWEPADGHPDSGFMAVVQRQWRDVLHPDLFYLGYGVSENTLVYKWHVGLMDAEPALYGLAADGPPAAGRWVHLAGVYDGETGETSLYVDGVQVAQQSHPGRLRLDLESVARPLAIGAEINGKSLEEPAHAFDGYIDEVRLYGRALMAGEIGALATEAKARFARSG